jgi:hypothetical protein
MMLQVVAPLTIIILMTLKLSFTLLENIYNTGVTNEDCHVMVKLFFKSRPHGAITLSIMTLSIMTLCIMALSKMTFILTINMWEICNLLLCEMSVAIAQIKWTLIEGP